MKYWLLSLLLCSCCGCATAHHAAVVVDATLASTVFAVDDAELTACQMHVLTDAKCAELNTPIKKALQDVKALTAALQATPNVGTVPASLSAVLQDLQTVDTILHALAQGPDIKPLVDKVQAAQQAVINQLAKLTGGA